MRLFLKHSCLFLLLLAVLLSLFDFLFSKWVQNSSRPCIESWHDLMYRQIDADLVIVGSSRAKNHIDPEILDTVLHTNAYNLGMSGTKFDLQAAQYNLYRSHNKKPNVILFCIDVFSLLPTKRVVFLQADYLKATERYIVETDVENVAKLMDERSAMLSGGV